MSMIGDEKIQEVRERASILDVVSEYVNLKKSGANYLGLCPFHGEKTPSFNVNPARSIFHCFGCGAGGNAISFIMKMEGLTFPEAVKFLAKRVGVAIEERPLTPAEKKRVDEREGLYSIVELAVRFYRRILLDDPAGEAGRRYLDRRGVDRETSEAYRLGFAPGGWDALARHLGQIRASLDDAEKLGLVRRKDNGGYYDLFRNRLLFTISDPHGRAVGFGGRVLDDSLPKYINSPESAIYHKSDILFGIDLAKQAMRGDGSAIIVEGYFDHLALYQAGIRNVAATCGTALTASHLKLLQRYATKIYTLFDSDSAGKKATFRAMELLLEAGVPSGVVELPAGDDPDSLIRKEGKEAFDYRIVKARPILEYYIRDTINSNDTGSIEGKVRVVDELVSSLKKISDPVELDLYLREIARLLEISERTLRRKVGGAAVSATDFSTRREKVRRGTDPEEMLLALMGKYAEVAGKVAQYGVDNLFSTEFRGVAESIIRCHVSGEQTDWGQILDQIEVPEERNRLASLFIRDEHLEGVDPLEMFEDLRRSREKDALRRLKELPRELAQEEARSGHDTPRYRELQAEFEALRKKKSQLQ